MEKLARATGLSRAAARSRVLQLIQEGQLRVTGILHPSSQGLSALAHLSISVRGSAHNAALTLAAIEQVTLVSIVAGDSALIAWAVSSGQRNKLTQFLHWFKPRSTVAVMWSVKLIKSSVTGASSAVFSLID